MGSIPSRFILRNKWEGTKALPYEKTIYLFLFYHFNLSYIVADKFFGSVAAYKS